MELEIVLKEKNIKLLDLLINFGLDSKFIMDRAISTKNFEVLFFLATNGGMDPLNILFEAIKFEVVPVVRHLLELNIIDLEAVNEKGKTPLMLAKEVLSYDIVNLLLEHGASCQKIYLYKSDLNSRLHPFSYAIFVDSIFEGKVIKFASVFKLDFPILQNMLKKRINSLLVKDFKNYKFKGFNSYVNNFKAAFYGEEKDNLYKEIKVKLFALTKGVFMEVVSRNHDYFQAIHDYFQAILENYIYDGLPEKMDSIDRYKEAFEAPFNEGWINQYTYESIVTLINRAIADNYEFEDLLWELLGVPKVNPALVSFNNPYLEQYKQLYLLFNNSHNDQLNNSQTSESFPKNYGTSRDEEGFIENAVNLVKNIFDRLNSSSESIDKCSDLDKLEEFRNEYNDADDEIKLDMLWSRFINYAQVKYKWSNSLCYNLKKLDFIQGQNNVFNAEEVKFQTKKSILFHSLFIKESRNIYLVLEDKLGDIEVILKENSLENVKYKKLTEAFTRALLPKSIKQEVNEMLQRLQISTPKLLDQNKNPGEINHDDSLDRLDNKFKHIELKPHHGELKGPTGKGESEEPLKPLGHNPFNLHNDDMEH
ncbi:MAG: hypothetical protein K0Q51_1598 [Rickettsiaceae bacterium]|jgi:hypothetical protein|nr:hypothetical protein [Rickettsiaceae bacterium]